MLLTFNLEENNIQELSKIFSLLANQNHLKIILNLKGSRSVKQIHELNLFNNYASTYKALNKLAKNSIIRKEKGKNKVGDLYSLPLTQNIYILPRSTCPNAIRLIAIKLKSDERMPQMLLAAVQQGDQKARHYIPLPAVRNGQDPESAF